MFVILTKKYLRSDYLWCGRYAFKSILRLIPLFLDTWALMRSQYASRSAIERYQDDRLTGILAHARNIPYWKDAMDGIAAEGLQPRELLSRLPITSKRDLVDKPFESIADVSLVRMADADHTSGSTGRPFSFYFDWFAGLRSFAFTERTFRTATRGKRYPIVYMRARERNGFTPWRHEWFYLMGSHGVKNRMNEFAKLAKKYPRGFIIYGYTSSVVELARQMESQDMKLPLRAVMAAGENLSESDRAYVQRVTGAEVYTLYASREAGFLAYECEEHKLHLNEEWAIVEVLDGEGRPAPDGTQGRVIVTTFDNHIMPFIRYDLGDLAFISPEQCPCGRTLKTISLRGRTAEMIEMSSGRRVALLDILTTVDQYWNSVRQFQIVQKGGKDFVFRVVPGPRFSHGGREELEGELKRLLGPEVRVSWEQVDTLPMAPSGKTVYFSKELVSEHSHA